MRGAIRTNSPSSRHRRSTPVRAAIERLESRTFLTSTPIPLPAGSAPGTIEAENYDNGGEGVAYHDTQTANPGGAYRRDGVGITPTRDAGGGYYVGWTHPTEWLQYTVNVAATTTYTLDVRLASINGGTFHFSSDGHAVTGAIKMPNTGGWENWTTVSVPGVNLTAGKHVIRLTFDTIANPATGVGNINWFRFRDNPATSPRTAWWRA
ncbi:MAG: carbohydrate binding module family protein, partial [Phycisphaerales bacterium]|nr:carbohydrate binding module family protein [Phycisphaerales bacterium]